MSTTRTKARNFARILVQTRSRGFHIGQQGFDRLPLDQRGDVNLFDRGDQTGGQHVIHATGHHGAVVIEAFAEADARHRVAGSDGPVIRRL